MNDNSILEPVDLYNREFKEKFKENCIKYFDDLVKKSQTNEDENRTFVKNYNTCKDKRIKLENNSNKKKAFKILLIIFIVIASIIALLSAIGYLNLDSTTRIVVPIALIVLVVLSIFEVIRLTKTIKSLKEKIDEARSQEEKELHNCWVSMEKLNASYDWNIPSDLMEMTTPLIDLDHYFDVNKFEYLHEKYGFDDANDPNSSTNYVISGNINGNPFVLLNTYNTEMRMKTYTGSITIYWTTYSTNSKGETVTHHHSETLTASIEKPAPVYFYDTRLIFGDDAAPDLNFTRGPVLKGNQDEKDIDRMVRRGEKKLQKKTEKSVMKGKQFNAMANSEFEVLFNALDRDNEQQFRLLFTPLGQKNMTKLIKEDPYGDDFYWYKRKCLNYIFSSHSQKIDYEIEPDNFVHYDIDYARENFIRINEMFFKGLYFDLAPLLSVPVYQQTKTHEYIYKIPYEAYNTKYEQEALANRFDKNILKHPNSRTDCIIKCDFSHKDNDTDYVTAHAYSYYTVTHTDYQTRLGGDGNLHTIPITWYEYLPLTKDTNIAVSKVNTTRQKFNNSNELINKLASKKMLVYERGLISCILESVQDFKDIKNKIIKKDEEK
ncbi:MAG: hypothetical protein K6G28_01375 [Acholeplasmatales bacterium]|nr:hypothetical protein [Acholeplasmatales bacterium]